MPTYTYACQKCSHSWDEFHGMSATPKFACPACRSTRTQKQLGTGAGFIFKGSGFYETDFKDKKGTPPAKEGGESKAAETKTDAAPKAVETPKPAAKKAAGKAAAAKTG
jgi:putative FmdB family regulatory protein